MSLSRENDIENHTTRIAMRAIRRSAIYEANGRFFFQSIGKIIREIDLLIGKKYTYDNLAYFDTQNEGSAVSTPDE